jgi:hypothetical protein
MDDILGSLFDGTSQQRVFFVFILSCHRDPLILPVVSSTSEPDPIIHMTMIFHKQTTRK